jgi:hypothetical protein
MLEPIKHDETLLEIFLGIEILFWGILACYAIFRPNDFDSNKADEDRFEPVAPNFRFPTQYAPV